MAGLTKMQKLGWDEFKMVNRYIYEVENDVVTVGPFLIGGCMRHKIYIFVRKCFVCLE